MKRDMDLARAILFAVEKHDYDGLPVTLQITGDYSPEQIEYHVMILGEAGLLDVPRKMTFGGDLRPTRLTWTGHDFVEAARSDTNWAKAQAAMAQAGGWVFSVGLEVLKQIIAQSAMAAINRPR